MKQLFTYLISFVACLLLRLIPFRPANAEPIMATLLPMSRLGIFGPMSFTLTSVLVYDLLTSGITPTTFLVGGVYGLISLAASSYFSRHTATRWRYAGFALLATLFFDAATGLTMGPLFYHQSFTAAALGQIPFTISHLVINVTAAVAISPLLEKYLFANQLLQLNPASQINQKTAA